MDETSAEAKESQTPANKASSSDIRQFFKPKAKNEENGAVTVLGKTETSVPTNKAFKRTRSISNGDAQGAVGQSPGCKRFRQGPENEENEQEKKDTKQPCLSWPLEALKRAPLRERSSSLTLSSSQATIAAPAVQRSSSLESVNSSIDNLVAKKVTVVIPLLKPKGLMQLQAEQSLKVTGVGGDAKSADSSSSSEDRKTEDNAKTTENLTEEAYEVEKIVDYSWCKVTLKGMYKVRWEGWAEEHDTWEVVANLEDCTEKLKEFYFERLKQRENATPSQKRFLEVPPDPRSSHEKCSDFADTVCPPPCMSVAEQFMKEREANPVKMWPYYKLKSTLESMSRRKNPPESKLNELKMQLMLKHVKNLTTDQQVRLKDWEREVNSLDSEVAKISVENSVDLEGPPRYMTYINEYKTTEGIIIPDDPPIGCECSACDIKNERSCCPGSNGHAMAYNKYGKLRIPVGSPIYECNKKCQCGSECFNRVVQKGRKIKLCVYRTPNGCGWGVKTLENIKRGSFVVEYVGEVITSEQAEERGKKYDAEGRTYLFDLDYNLGDANPYTVDAAFYGNISHFINHSCDPNLAIFNVWIDCLDPNLPRLCMFAVRDIVKGEQITFDYRQRAADGNETLAATAEESAESSEDGDQDSQKTQMECRCESHKCRKILFC